MSVTPAGGNGTMILTGLLGYCWAKAEPGITSATASATMRMNLLISGLSFVTFFSPGCCSRHWRQSGHICERLVRLMQARAPIDVQLMAPAVRAGTRRTYRHVRHLSVF